MLLAVAGDVFGGDTAQVSLVAAAINAGVGVQDLAPSADPRQADAISFPRHGREIQDGGELVRAVGGLAENDSTLFSRSAQSIQENPPWS